MSNLISVCQQNFKSNRDVPAGILLILTALLITTPLCNQIFNCGCTWPWEGLDSHCNFHLETTVHKCPWCISWLTAGLSLGSALLLGYALSMHNVLNRVVNASYDYLNTLARFSLGISVFIGVAYFCGTISALLLAYPL